MTRILYLGPPEGFEAVRAALDGHAEAVHVAAESGAVAQALGTADGLIDASMKVPISDAMIAAAPNLRIISTATTGADHIARRELDARGIALRTLKEDPDVLRDLTPAAEMSWALLMACARGLVPAAAHTRSGRWIREEFPGVMLRGKTLGVIGCGRIGQWMARYAAAFGMDVVGHDPYVQPWPGGIRRLTLEALVELADFISVHVHLSDETRGLVSRDLFGRMKPGAVVINTSRGAVIDESALLDGLKSGRLRGAGLDVLDGEPDIDGHPLVEYARSADNLVITPHCGGYSPDAVRIVCGHAARKGIDFLAKDS